MCSPVMEKERCWLTVIYMGRAQLIMGQQLAFPPWLLLSMHLDSHLEVGLKRAVPPPPLLLLPILAARSIGEVKW